MGRETKANLPVFETSAPSASLGLAVLVLWVAFVVCACGYQSARPAAGERGWCVKSGDEPATHPQAVAALEFGVRDALAAHASLASCEDGPTLLIQVVDVRLESMGVVASEQAALSRATRVSVSAVGHVLGEGEPQDVGMVEEHHVVGTGATAASQQHAIDAGVVTAARRAGEALVKRLLGEPVPATHPR